MERDLYTQAGEVVDEVSFLEFLTALAQDREDEVKKEAASQSSPFGRGANGWENGTIEAFLGAALAWAMQSRDGMPYYDVPDNPWTRCAQILLMGKIYE